MNIGSEWTKRFFFAYMAPYPPAIGQYNGQHSCDRLKDLVQLGGREVMGGLKNFCAASELGQVKGLFLDIFSIGW